MNEQEHQQAFLSEYNALVGHYGLAFDAIASWEVLGAVLQVRGQLTIKQVEGWKPPEDDQAHEPPLVTLPERNGKHVKAPR